MKKLLLFLFCIPFIGITQNSHTINTVGNSFSPYSLTINVGDTVTWNNTAGYHNVNGTQATFPNNPQGFGNSVGAGWTFQWIFTLAGTYDYQCDPHAGMGMTGVIIVNSSTLAADLFISEYAEGSGTNKYIEIFNGTGQDVDLSNYQLWKVTNGGTWPEYTFNLSSILSHNHVYIVYSSSSSVDPLIAAAGDVTWSQVTWTGDDAIGLAKQVPAQSGSSFSLIDAIGEDGPDPGNGWNVAGVTDATKDHTLVRKCSVTQGNINWGSSSGTNAQDSEWDVFSQNYWTDIDQHTFPCQSAPVYGCTDSTAINFDPLATIDDGSCIGLTFGCTDSTAFNYNATANSDDGSCCFQSGCTDPVASNYDPSACYNDGSCITPIFGCPNTSAMNFDSTATIDDGSCVFLVDKIDLFFSEYGEGSSNNKYIEIYNSTSNPVNLYSYALTRVSNSPTTVGVYEYWVDFDSAAVILANDVYIVAHPSSDSVILDQADMTYSALSNGDDGFALVYGGKPLSPVLPGNEYVILDFLGDFNGDPGSGWSVAGVSDATKDHTLVRKCDVTQGNNDWVLSAGTNTTDSEWEVLPQNDWTNLGFHTTPCATVSGCTDPTALNYNPSATIDDGSCVYCTYGCTDSTAFNYDATATCDDGNCIAVVYGCTDQTAYNYYAGANIDDGSCCYAAGCTDPLATNYDANACIDDGSCSFTSACANSPITGLFISDIIDDQVLANFDNMNTYDATGAQICRVDQIRIKYREVGTSAWSQKNIASPTGYDPTTGVCNSTQKTDKPIRNLTPATEYEWEVKVWYCNGGNGGWAVGPNFTTAGECPNVGNLTAYGANPTKATFDWDDSNGSYEFARIKMRVDSISNPLASDWFLVGGSGVSYGTFTKNKNGLVAGETYRGQARTWCDPNGGAYNALSWTSLVTWTQPASVRVEGGASIANLDIYPNPSRDVFNITFTSESIQDLRVRILNVVGEVIASQDLQQFTGEYTKQINLEDNAKGIYFLEIETNDGIINKKLMLQ